jgi:hypothetical protein
LIGALVVWLVYTGLNLYIIATLICGSKSKNALKGAKLTRAYQIFVFNLLMIADNSFDVYTAYGKVFTENGISPRVKA